MFATPAAAAPGDLDPSFGTGGAVLTDFPPNRSDEAGAMLLLPDGKILLGGGSDGFIALARYQADGSVDTAFGTQGRLVHTLQGRVLHMALQADGKILAVADSPYASSVVRFSSDGTLDTGFGNQGVLPPLFNDGVGRRVAVRADGRIFVTGNRILDYSRWCMEVAGFLPDGNPDPAFGAGGRALADMGRDAKASAITIDAQNRILVAGYRSETSGNDLAIARFLPGGTLDPAFDGDGKTTVSVGYIDETLEIVILPDGRIQLAAVADQKAALARLLPDGTPDLSFDGDGKVTTTASLGYSSQENPIAAAVAADGTTAMAGWSSDYPSRLAVARIRADGTLDPAFNGTGLATVALGAGGSRAAATAILADGKILAAGYAAPGAKTDFAVARFLVEGPGAKVKPGIYHWDGATQFGSAYLRGPATTRTFTLENQGTAPLGNFSIGFDGTGAADYSSTSTLPESLAPGASVTFQVAFSPQAAGVRPANLRVHSNDPTRSPFTIALTGTGITRPLIRVEMPDGTPIEKSNDHAGGLIDFGASPAGVPVDLTLTIRNPGSADLTGLAASTAGLDASQFTIVTPPVAPVAPDGSTTLTVRFTPLSFGEKTAPLQIPSNADSQFYIRMIGTGIAPSLAVADPEGKALQNNSGGVVFGSPLAGDSVTRTVTLRNVGTAELSLNSLVLEGEGAGSFKAGPLPAAPLPPGGSATLGITFHPALQGQHLATLGFGTNDPAVPQFRCSLVGEALAPVMQVYDDHGFVAHGGVSRFDPVLPGKGDEQSFWIVNQGNADLTGITVTLSGEHAENFSIVSPPPSEIGPWGQAAAFTVRFTAPAAGPRSAELRIHSNDLTAPSWLIQLHAEARESVAFGDGRLDPTFGSAGDGEPLLPGLDPDYELLVQPDGKILTVGTQGGEQNADFHVARFLPDGTPDPGWGGDGQVAVDRSQWEQARGAALQSDGRLVVAGYSGDHVVVIRLLTDGSMDPSFGENGVVSSPAGGLEFLPEEVAIRPDGTILVVGYQYSEGWSTPVIIGLLANGMPDVDFGTAGVAVDPLTEWDANFSSAVQADGAVLEAGWYDGEFRLVRFLPDGTLDVTFGEDGRVTGRIGDGTALTCVTLQPDGRSLLGGTKSSNDRYENIVLRLLPDGSPDPDFGNAGVALLEFPSPVSVVDLALQSDGRCVVAAEIIRDGVFHIALTRLNANGSIDPGFGDSGLVIDPPGSNPVLALAADGDLILAARTNLQGEAGLGLFRFASGLPASGTFVVSPASDVQAGDLLSGAFTDWVSDHPPLAYQVRVNGVPVAPPSTDPTVALAAPLAPGLHEVVGRITDARGRFTEVTRTLRVVATGTMWRSLHFGSDPENGDDADDPDADGRSNLLEFATGGDPRSGSNHPEQMRVTGDRLVFTYQRDKAAVLDGVNFAVEWSDGLAGEWTSSAVEERALDQGDHEQITATLPAGTTGRRFVRLRVERP